MLHASVCENRQRKSSSPIQSSSEARREFHPPLGSQWNNLHSAYGNQAILRMLSRSAPSLQTKLAVNQPGDAFEQEADRVAAQVMRMSVPGMVRSDGSAEKVQRKCAECEDEEKKTGLQKKEAGAGPQVAPPSVHNVLNSPGHPLDPATRAFMEPRFGYDFSQVRVHTDQQASESARDVNALAYTVGKHTVFSAGQYAPNSVVGRQLIAHELAHVIQQGFASGHSPFVQRQPADHTGGSQGPTGASPMSSGRCYTCEIPGGLGICCYAAETPVVPECFELGKSIIDKCPGKPESCLTQAQCAQCKCLAAKAGPQYCQCTGMV